MTSHRPSRIIPIILSVLILLGILVSGYLLNRTILLMSDRAMGTIDVCSGIFGAGCDRTLMSRASWFLGIPLSGWSLVYYGVLSGLILLGRFLEGFRSQARVLAWVLSAAAMLISLVLAGILLTGRIAFCPLCIVAHGINLILPFALWMESGESWSSRKAVFARGTKLLLGDEGDPRLEILALFNAALVAVLLYQWVLIQVEIRTESALRGYDAEAVRSQFRAEPKHAIPVSPGDPHMGPIAAPVQLVVFTNFQCPGCRALARQVMPLAERYTPHVSVVLKHFPLSTACNPGASIDKHPRSCQLAWAAEAAHLQGRFWEYHDGLFGTGLDGGEETILAVAEAANLDLTRFEEDRHGTAVRKRVGEDIALGNSLGVDETPSAFLNGKRVRVLARRVLRTLIEDELDPEARPPRPTP